ncbi:MAG: hypothetical protein NZ702_03470 [Gammaproteobacteria bacterium]|nr:hypothetical protein [Gammaproteobacteria bacterium]
MYVVQDSVALRSDKLVSDTNIIKNLPKDTQLTLITMHYSGWSKVSLGGSTGWILSDKLTKKVPDPSVQKKIKTSLLDDSISWILSDKLTVKESDSSAQKERDAALDKLQLLEQELLRLKNENKDLSSKSLVYKEITDKKIADSGEKIATLTVSLGKIRSENNQLSSQKNVDLQTNADTQSSSDDNALLLIIIGLISGFVISFIVVRILRRKQNKLNVVSRSY